MNSKRLSIDLSVDLNDHEMEVFTRAIETLAVAYKERSISLEESEDRVRVVAEFNKKGSPAMQNAHALWIHRGA